MLRLLVLFFIIFDLSFAINLKSIFTYTFNPNQQYDYETSKKLYFDKKCNQCHGEKGEKKVANSKIIKDMSAQDLKAALINYTLNSSNKVTSTNIIMYQYAKELSHKQMDEIIAYLKGDDFAMQLQIEDLKQEEPENKTEYGTFIK